MAIACSPENKTRFTVIAPRRPAARVQAETPRDIVALDSVGVGTAPRLRLRFPWEIELRGPCSGTSLMQWAASSSGRVNIERAREMKEIRGGRIELKVTLLRPRGGSCRSRGRCQTLWMVQEAIRLQLFVCPGRECASFGANRFSRGAAFPRVRRGAMKSADVVRIAFFSPTVSRTMGPPDRLGSRSH